MKKKFLVRLATLPVLARAFMVSTLAVTAVPAALAANITWSTGPTFNGPNGHLGILTNGTLVESVNMVGLSVLPPPLTVDPLGLSITFTSINSPFFGASWGAATGGGNSDPNWAAILTSFEWSSGGNVTAADFLRGLTVGHQYQVQFFAARGDCCGSRVASFSDGIGAPSIPVSDDSYTSIVGSFVADTGAQTIRFIDSSSNPILNAYVLRDLTPAVPEPETYAMLLGGLGLLGFVARLRKQQAA